MPTSVWVSTTQDVGDGMTANVRADMDVESKNAVIDCRINNGRDSVAVDFDTADSTMGPLRITKHLDLNGKKVGSTSCVGRLWVIILFGIWFVRRIPNSAQIFSERTPGKFLWK